MSVHSSNSYLSLSQMQDNATYIFSYLSSKGWSKNAICGMLGNMQIESTINPGIWQNLDEGNTSLGVGLIQWTPATKLIDWCESEGLVYSEMDSNLKRILYEVENNIQWIATSEYNFSFKEFTTSTKTPSYLASAFLKNYERAGVEVESERQENAVYWYNYLGDYSGNSQIIEDAINWAVSIANDDSHGYDQNNRWGPDYDCSSLIIQAFENAGCPVKTNGATYTGNMQSVFSETGFQVLTYTGNDSLIRGDVLLRDGHTALYMGNGQVVSAHINENGETTGGTSGDQTGQEIDVSSYISTNWEVVLRLPTNITPVTPSGSSSSKKNKFNFILFNHRRRGIYG